MLCFVLEKSDVVISWEKLGPNEASSSFEVGAV
jgi:hypothetical protein